MSKLSNLVALGLLAIFGVATVNAQHDPHFTQNRTTIVHLFEWRWNDIAEECEKFLGPQGYGGVQTSPPNENVVANNAGQQRPWWERYQPVSYKLVTRSGNEEEFKSMVKRCNAVGVRVYVDAVINHMSGDWPSGTPGTGGSSFDTSSESFEAVPYTNADFNGRSECPSSSGNIENYGDVNQVRNCKLSGLHDLNHGKENVRGKIAEFLNKLISFGVAGFRIDASKHMWPADMKAILSRLNSLPVEQGFASGARPFVYQEVIDLGGEAITAAEYTGNGRVTEFKVCANIGNIFRRSNQKLSYLKNWGEGWGMLNDTNAFVFVDNHDNQRGHGAGGDSILTFRVSRMYKMAQAFTLAWPYGVPRVMSSYYWDQNIVDGKDQNDWVGPPHDNNFDILPPAINTNMTCGNGWQCEHRWRQIYNMVGFRNVVKGTQVENWWDNQKDQIAFSRGNRGFLAINNDDSPLNAYIQSSLPAGSYCDIISGTKQGSSCTGKTVTVGADGKVNVQISNSDEDPMIAIHVNAKL